MFPVLSKQNPNRRKTVKLDTDVKKMSSGERGQEIARLRKLIRTHKRKRDNARCWHGDEELYARTLPEGSRNAGRMTLPEDVLLRNCRKYIRGQKCSKCK
jgi:hypothetical protein